METKVINASDVTKVIAAIPKSAIFTVEFVKANGELRKMNCRTGVVSHLTPPSLKKREKPEMPSNILTVFDMQAGAYRHVNLSTTKRIVAEHTVFVVK